MSEPHMTAWVIVEGVSPSRTIAFRYQDGIKYTGPTVRSALAAAQRRARRDASYRSRGDYQFRVVAVGVDRSNWPDA